METEKLYSPIDFYLHNPREEERGGEYGAYDIYDERYKISDAQAFEYIDAIELAIRRDRDHMDSARGMAEYLDDALGSKVTAIFPSVEPHGGALWCVADITLSEQLTPEELTELKLWWSGQLSDGWGEGFEQRGIEIGREELYVVPWTSDEEFFIDARREFNRRMSIETVVAEQEHAELSPARKALNETGLEECFGDDTTNSKLITDHENVRELLNILQDNNIDAKDFTAMLASVAAIEKQLSSAAGELSAMRSELANMREERDHPLRAALQRVARSLSGIVNGLRAKLKAVKDGITGGCRRAVDAFKFGGVSALQNLVGFFEVKPALASLRDGLNKAIASAEDSIAGIESACEQYHSAARHLKNAGRVIRGKEPIPDIQPNGKLARLLESPFHLELRNLNGSLRGVNRALAGVDRLEKAAAKQAEASRPSTRETMKNLREQTERRKKDTPTRDAEKRTDIAI
jgi:hypothetical protein